MHEQLTSAKLLNLIARITQMEKGQDIIPPWSKPLDLRFLSYTPVPDTL